MSHFVVKNNSVGSSVGLLIIMMEVYKGISPIVQF